MIRYGKHIKPILLCSLLVTAYLTALAQDSIPDLQYLITSQPWLSSENAVGLDAFTHKKASIATAYFNKDKGDYTNYYESDNSYTYGILSESYYRINPRLTVYGKVDYSSFSGENMSGSGLIDPYYNAFNIVEYTQGTAGQKTKECYTIIGGLSHKISNSLILGLKGDYKNISYFKTKDLRHTNDLLDFKLSAGLAYKWNKIDLGLNYKYHRSVESIVFETFGNTDKKYDCLIDYGSFFGYLEQYDDTGTGITRGIEQKPYFHQENGIGLQLNLKPNEKLSIFNELTLNLGAGQFGKRSTTTIVYTEHETSAFSLKSITSLRAKKSLHQLELYGDYAMGENWENDYLETGGSSETGSVITYGIPQMVNNRTRTNLSLNYNAFLNIQNDQPLWNINANISYRSHYQRSIYYEVLSYRRQEINQVLASISAYRKLYSGKNTYQISAGVAYGSGSGYALEDTHISSIPSPDDVNTMDQYTYREFEYFTASKLKGYLGLRYSRSIKEDKSQIYGELQYKATKAFDTVYVGDYFGSLKLSVGYQF